MKRVILINLGGPRNTDEIEKFLTDLFTDPYIFDLPLPRFLQIQLGKFIAKKRAPKVKHAYESLDHGGGSPLVSETIKQATKLEERLNQLSTEKWKVEVQMTCGFPNLRDINLNLQDLNTGTFLVPLYPQYSRSTTLSALKIVQSKIGFCPVTKEISKCSNESCSNLCKTPNLKIKGWINPFYNNLEFIEASTSLILDFFEGRLSQNDFIHLEKPPQEDWKTIPILFSAHGIPLRLVRKGDPYPQQIEETRTLIVSKLKELGYKAETFLSYQSKVGPARWTEPSTLETIEQLGKQGYKSLAIYPISFVSDHLETIEEIGRELKTHAFHSGIHNCYRIPALGIYPKFIECLANMILKN